MRQYRQHLHRRDLLLVTEADFKDLDERLAPQRRALAGAYQECAIPKPAPRKRSAKAMEQARKRTRCEVCCRACKPHPHHIKSRGAGGSDDRSNLISVCAECHTQIHAGKIGRDKLREIVARRAA